MNPAEELRRRLATGGSLILSLKITPKSPRTAWAGVLDDGVIKIRVAAPPEKGKANAELIRFLAHELGLQASRIEIISGAASTRKLVRLSSERASPAA
ncbi:MAG: DUF167 domain-containing protein [Bryobacteraceae bacterium]|nr:DUF167 domain-containing protein [Bryobacteraceae bacterium]